MVDWSGGNSRAANGPNCLWIAHGGLNDLEPATASPRSRTEAIEQIVQLSCQVYETNDQGRILACLDFGFAFPRGLASHLPSPGPNSPLWQRVWSYLGTHVNDDVGTKAGRVPSNKSNRFEVANNLNFLIQQNALGPFWCVDPNWRHRQEAAGIEVSIGQNQPRDFISHLGIEVPQSRIVDNRVQSDSPFRLFGNGSVGSQILTGIPRLQQLRQSQRLKRYGQNKVWPFETGWADAEDDEWLNSGVRLVLAEIYPSVRPALEDNVVDRGQVRAMWHWARDLDRRDELRTRFERPNDLTDAQEGIVRCEEGWILH